MKRLTLLTKCIWLLVVLLFSSSVWAGIEGEPAEENASETESAIKTWSMDDPLVWDDFQASPAGGRFAAQTVWSWQSQNRMLVNCSQASGQPWRCVASLDTPLVQAIFLKEFSWVTASGRLSRDLLAHEQGHFDLVEVFARRMTSDLNALQVTVENDDRLQAETESFNALDEAAQALINQWSDQAIAEQERYERETNHGTVRSAQTRWQAQIRSLLIQTDPTSVSNS